MLGQDYDASHVILKLVGCDLCTGAVDVVFIMVANMKWRPEAAELKLVLNS